MRGISAVVLCLLFVLCRWRVSESSNIDEDRPFRMRKVNLVWEKAKRLAFGKERLNALFVELQKQDKNELKLKHQKSEGLDKDGEMEATLLRSLTGIMEKYGLGGGGDSSPNSSENMFDMESNRVRKASYVRDERVDRLWQTAVEEAQFTKHELEALRQELDHHDEKWQQYNKLVGLLSEHENRHENAIGKKNHEDTDELNKLREEMNLKQKEVDSSYHKLKVKVFKGPDNEEFQDYRVRDLWKRAKAQGLPGEELDIIKEELKHFDHKIAKHDDIQEQVDVAEELLRQGHDHIKQKHEKLSSKLKEHRRYIKKLHVTLDRKIGPHNEL